MSVDIFTLEFQKWCEENDAILYGTHELISFGDGVWEVDLKAIGDDEVELYRIRVYHENRKQGIGGTVLKALCRVADQHQIHLNLEADASGTEEGYGEWLVSWYESYGFKQIGIGEHGSLMTRLPT